MTREENSKVCRVCKNMKQDYEHGMICGLTNSIGSFEDKCASFIPDEEEVLRSIKRDTENQKLTEELIENSTSESPWRTMLSILIVIIAVIRLIVALSK